MEPNSSRITYLYTLKIRCCKPTTKKEQEHKNQQMQLSVCTYLCDIYLAEVFINLWVFRGKP